MINLIPEWKQSWRFTSVQAAAILFALSLLQSDVLPSVQPLVPPKYWPFVTAGFALVIWFFRVVAQQALHQDPEAKE